MSGHVAGQPASMRNRLVNLAASLVFVGAAYAAYRFAPHVAGLRDFTDPRLGLSGGEVLAGVAVGYGVLLALLYLLEREPGRSKSVDAMAGLRRLVLQPMRVFEGGWPAAERLGLLSILLKAFFAPLMLMSLFEFTSTMVSNGYYLVHHLPEGGEPFLPLFNSHGFWFLFQLILFVDVFFFTVGYLVEHRRLGNEIRSVDPTLLGWAVAVACYPPFNAVTAMVLGGNIAEFPRFENPVVHISVNVLLLLSMGVYASASVALNLKASNLTHRGIVMKGPYRLIRHPAYAAKNLAWWLGSLPGLAVAWDKSLWSFVLTLCAIAAWNTLYVMRALTEEAHLRSVDDEYNTYCNRVRWRFIPRVF